MRGEEFGCILPDTDNDAAVRLAERIRIAVKQRLFPNKRSETSDYVTISLGMLTTSCTSETKADELISRCNELLYKAKEDGRNRTVSLDQYYQD